MALILVVDDVPDNVKLLTYDLEDDGHDVAFAEDGIQALEYIEHTLPDLLLLDINMPRLNGIETLKRIKEQERLS